MMNKVEVEAWVEQERLSREKDRLDKAFGKLVSDIETFAEDYEMFTSKHGAVLERQGGDDVATAEEVNEWAGSLTEIVGDMYYGDLQYKRVAELKKDKGK